MVSFGAQTSSDTKEQFQGAVVQNGQPQPIPVLGYEVNTDIGNKLGQIDGEPRDSHLAELLITGQYITWGPLRRGVYEFSIGNSAPSGGFNPAGLFINYRCTSTPEEIPSGYDFPMGGNQAHPVSRVKLREGQNFIRFYNPHDQTILVFGRRLV